jgi:hypothetical protein
MPTTLDFATLLTEWPALLTSTRLRAQLSSSSLRTRIQTTTSGIRWSNQSARSMQDALPSTPGSCRSQSSRASNDERLGLAYPTRLQLQRTSMRVEERLAVAGHGSDGGDQDGPQTSDRVLPVAGRSRGRRERARAIAMRLTTIWLGLLACALGACGPPKPKEIAWTEDVELPDGRTITVARMERVADHYSSSGDAGHRARRRSPLIPG